MLKILQFGMDPASRIGGIGIYLINQFRATLSSDIKYDFVHVYDDPMAFQDEIAKRSEIYYLPERRKHTFRYYLELLRLFHKLSKEDYLGIVMNMGGLAQALPLLLAKWYGFPVRIAHSHASGSETAQGWGRRFLYLLNRKIVLYSVTDLWACSKSAGQYLFHSSDVRVVHNGIETDRYVYNADIRNQMRKKYNLDGKIVLGHVGRFSPVKNHFFLLKLFRVFYEQHPNAVLMLVGDDKNLDAYDGYVRKIKEYVQKNHLESNVIFAGFSPNIAPFYQAMDIFLLPSFSEGLSLVSIEAQASNLPCIVSTGVPEDVVITDNIRRIALDDKNKWLNELNKLVLKKIDRKNNKACIIEFGYDSAVTMQEIKKYWKELPRSHG